MIWTGFVLASRSMPAIAVVTALLGWAYQRRVNAEEKLLHPEVPGYTNSVQHAKKLIPYVW